MNNNTTNVNTGGGSLNMIGSAVGSDNQIKTLGNISATVQQAIDRLPNSPKADEPGIKKLLSQLQQAIEQETELPAEDKADLMEQVKVLAEVKQTTEVESKEGLARKAKKIFEATLKSLPDTAKIVEASTKLLPMIFKALGLPA